MGIASGDADNDGDEDLFVTNIIGETFALYENDGKANFEDARSRWGLAQPTASFTGFGTEWIDYDNDGALDLFATNGAVNVIESQRGQPAPFRMKNLLFHNGGTRRFVDVSGEAGPAFALDQIGRGAAFGDLDNDGDTDIVVTNNNGPVRLLINEAARGAHWAQIRLQQDGGNRDGLGRMDRRRAREAADAVAAGTNRWQLSVGRRRPGSLWTGKLRGCRRSRRPMAGRGARAVESAGRRPGDDAAARNGKSRGGEVSR